MVLWRPTRPSRTNTSQRCAFHYRGLECKSRKSGDIWSNWQNCPWSTKWSRAKANRVLPRECTDHSKHPFPTTQEKTDCTRGHHPDGQYQNQTEYILCRQRWRSTIYSAKTRPGADYGSDHELLIVKFKLTLKKVGKTSRPFRYDLNQIPYDYIVEVTNSFKGLDLIDSAWGTMDRVSWHCTEGNDQDHHQEKEMQKGKMDVWGGLTNSWEKKRSKRQRRKVKIYPPECRVPKNSNERKESLPQWSVQTDRGKQ